MFLCVMLDEEKSAQSRFKDWIHNECYHLEFCFHSEGFYTSNGTASWQEYVVNFCEFHHTYIWHFYSEGWI